MINGHANYLGLLKSAGLHTFMAHGSSDRSWKPAMLRRENTNATSCSENLHSQHAWSNIEALHRYCGRPARITSAAL